MNTRSDRISRVTELSKALRQLQASNGRVTDELQPTKTLSDIEAASLPLLEHFPMRQNAYTRMHSRPAPLVGGIRRL